MNNPFRGDVFPCSIPDFASREPGSNIAAFHICIVSYLLNQVLLQTFNTQSQKLNKRETRKQISGGLIGKLEFSP